MYISALNLDPGCLPSQAHVNSQQDRHCTYNVKGNIHPQLNWAILLYDATLDGIIE